MTTTKTKGLTRARLERFVKVRNKSEYQSNLQFLSDCESCGFRVGDLGDVTPVVTENGKHYVWTTPFGKLIEEYGKLRIE